MRRSLFAAGAVCLLLPVGPAAGHTATQAAGPGAGQTAAQAPQEVPDGLYARVATPRGTITIRLEHERAPMTVASFVGLAEGTILNDAFDPGRPFFDGSRFQRVVPGHVIQGGGADSERSGSSGFPLPNEIHPDLRHDHAGAMGMANGGPHTGMNQFYITLGDRSYLDPDYTVFGEVVDGMDVAFAIQRDDAIDSVRIVRVGESAEAVRPDTDSFRRLAAEVRQRVMAEETRRRLDTEAYVNATWPGTVSTEDGLRHLILEEGSGPPPMDGDTVRVRYGARAIVGTNATDMEFGGMEFGSTAPRGAPGWLPSGTAFGDEDGSGEAFDFVISRTSLHEGLDRTLARMRAGERRLVVVPSGLAYGTSGHYAPERPGESRFRISPNTLLVYDIQRLDVPDPVGRR